MLPWDYIQPIVRDRTFAGWIVAHPDTLAMMQEILDETNIKGYPDPNMEPNKIMVGYKGPKHEEGWIE